MTVRQIEPIDRAELRATIQKWIDAHTDVDDTDGVGLLEDVLWEINAQPTLTPLNEPLTCTGCMYSPDCPSEIHCFGCARLYTDNYRRPPEGSPNA